MKNFVELFKSHDCNTFKDPSQDAASRTFLAGFKSAWDGLESTLPENPKDNVEFAPYFVALAPLADGLLGDNSLDWENPDATERCVVIEMLKALNLKDHNKALEDKHEDEFKDKEDQLKDLKKDEENALKDKYKEDRDKVEDKDVRKDLKKQYKEDSKALDDKYDDQIDLLKDQRKCKDDEFKNAFKAMEDKLEALEDIFDEAFDKDAEGFRFFSRDIEEFAALEMGKDETKTREKLFEACEENFASVMVDSMVSTGTETVHSEL